MVNVEMYKSSGYELTFRQKLNDTISNHWVTYKQQLPNYNDLGLQTDKGGLIGWCLDSDMSDLYNNNTLLYRP